MNPQIYFPPQFCTNFIALSPSPPTWTMLGQLNTKLTFPLLSNSISTQPPEFISNVNQIRFLPCLSNPPALFRPFTIVFKIKSRSWKCPAHFPKFVLNPTQPLSPHCSHTDPWYSSNMLSVPSLEFLPLYFLYLECSCPRSSRGWLLILQASLPLLFQRNTLPIYLSWSIKLS